MDLSSWVAFQEWVAQGPTEVHIPYAERLSEHIPPVATRLRRDFTLLLTMIKAHVLLHQDNRDRDDQGRLLATVEDFATIRELVGPYMAEGLEATVSPTIRETVEAVTALKSDNPEGVRCKALEEQLQLDKSAVNRRVNQARARGF